MFATLAPQIFCPHPSFPTSPCLYLGSTGWYEVGVDMQSRKRWRRWVYRSAISLEWVIRVDQWSRVEVTGRSENFDRGPHNSHNHTSQSARAAAVEDSWTNKRTEHTIIHSLLHIVDISIWIYICICTIFVFAFAFFCSVEGGPWANKQAITRLDHKRRWTMAPLWNHLHGHRGHSNSNSNLTHHTHALHTGERKGR